MRKLRQLAGQTTIYGLGTVIPRLLNYLLLTPFYTRVLEQRDYGVFSELYSYTAILLVLLTYGMETAFFRFSQSEQDPKRVYGTAMTSLFVSTSVFVAGMLLFLTPISNLVHYGDHRDYLFYITLIIALDAITAVSFAKLRYENKALKFALIRIANIVVTIGIVLFFLGFCPWLQRHYPNCPVLWVYSPQIGVGYAFLANLAGSLLQLVLLLPEMFADRPQFDGKLLGRMLVYALPLIIVGLGGAINENADKIMLKYLLPASQAPLAQVGVYAASYKVAVLMLIFVQMFRYAAEPFYFTNAKDRHAKDLFAEVMKYFVLCGLCIFLGVMLFLDVVKYFIGAHFWSGLRIVPIILISYLFFGIISNLSIWYKLENKTIYGAAITAIGAAITIVINYALIPTMGYMASAWATLICYAVMMVISYLWGQRHFRIHYAVGRLTFYFVLAMAIYGFCALVPLGRWAFAVNLVLVIAFMAFCALRERLWRLRRRRPAA